MPQAVYIEELPSHVGKEVAVRGWLFNKRSSGKIRFLIVRDGTGFLQCVATVKDTEAESFELCERLPQETSLIVTGTVRADPRAPGGYELLLKKIAPVQIPKEQFPIALKEHGLIGKVAPQIAL